MVYRTGEVQEHKSEWLTPLAGGLVKTCLLAFYYAIYYAILFFTTIFTTLREAPANDLYVFWHVPNRQYGNKSCLFCKACGLLNILVLIQRTKIAPAEQLHPLGQLRPCRDPSGFHSLLALFRLVFTQGSIDTANGLGDGRDGYSQIVYRRRWRMAELQAATRIHHQPPCHAYPCAGQGTYYLHTLCLSAMHTTGRGMQKGHLNREGSWKGQGSSASTPGVLRVYVIVVYLGCM